MLWLNARSLMELGMTTATRNFSVDVLAAPPPQAVRTRDNTTTKLKSQANFIFFSLIEWIRFFLRDGWSHFDVQFCGSAAFHLLEISFPFRRVLSAPTGR